MPVYEINWTEELFHRATITADTEDEARRMFWEHGLQPEKTYGSEIQDSVDVEEIETPCDVCGLLIPTDIHREELGMCVDCSNDYFDHAEKGADHADHR